MVLIDEPRWADDGMRFAHLVSDESLGELDAFVARLALPRRPRFHHDHYDIPAVWWDAVVAQGATVVTTRELIRRLRRAGLRRSR